jgi:hypothetical protein
LRSRPQRNLGHVWGEPLLRVAAGAETTTV